MAEKKSLRQLSSVWPEVRALLWRYRKHLLAGFALMSVNRLAGLVLPLSLKFLIDDVLTAGRAELIVPLAAGVGAAVLLQGGTSFGLAQVVSIAGQRAVAEMRKALQQHVLRLPVPHFDSTAVGSLVSRVMRDTEGLRNLVGTGLVQLAGGLLTAVLATSILFYLNWRLTALVLLVLAGFGGGMAFAFKWLRPIFRERHVIEAELTGRLTEALGGIRVLKVYTAEQREARIFARGVHRLLRNIARAITGTSLAMAFSTLVVGVISVLLIVVGGNHILAGEMTLGHAATFVALLGVMAAPVIQFASIGTQITEALAGLDRIRELRRIATEDEADGAKLPIGELDGDVVFESVSFEYEPGVPVLRDISLNVPAGATIALVGSSGSGKTTLVNLVMGFVRPQSGRVLVDGRNLTSIPLREYRSQLGVVLQDNVLFDGTIAENIEFGRPGASRDAIREAGRIAHCNTFVAEFEKGYDTVVGERGVKLSGGQRQRVAIARAILADPRILILDEATSSLDSESEATIRDGLRALLRGRTTFVIAHRLSTISRADQILVIEDGRIVERGTHVELLARRGRYRELHDRQYEVERDLFVAPGEDVPDPYALPAAAAASVAPEPRLPSGRPGELP